MHASAAFRVSVALLWGLAAAAPAHASYLYALGNSTGSNFLYGFHVEADGSLTALPGFPVHNRGSGVSGYFNRTLALREGPGGATLFALNLGSDSLAAYAVDPLDGSVSHLSYSPLSLDAGSDWTAVAASPDGRFLFLAREGSDGNFVVVLSTADATTAPTVVESHSVEPARPGDLVLDAAGDHVYAGGRARPYLASLGLEPDGSLSDLTGSPVDTGISSHGAYAVAGEHLILARYGGGGGLYALPLTAGAPGPPPYLGPFPTDPPAATTALEFLAPDLLVANSREQDALVMFRVAWQPTLQIAELPSSPYPTGGEFPDALAVARPEALVFAGNSDTRNISSFRLDPTAGTLTLLAVQPVNAVASAKIGGLVVYAPRVSVIEIPTLAATGLLVLLAALAALATHTLRRPSSPRS